MARTDYYDDPAAPEPNSIVPSVCAFVVHGGQLLLIHKLDNNHWALPGGGVDPGESALAACVREVREETGADIEITGLVGIFTDPRHVMAYTDGEVRQQFSLCFTGRFTGGDLHPQEGETSQARWVSLDQIDQLDVHKSMALRIRVGLAASPDLYLS